MSAFEGPQIIKLNGGLGRRNASTDSVMGLLFGGVATSQVALGEVKKLIQLSDAEELGINASYDANHNVLVHYHILEFFRLSPSGTLYIMLVAQGTTLTAMCSFGNDYLKKLITDQTTNREAKSFGVVLNPDDQYIPVVTAGIDDDSVSAITQAQLLVDRLRGESIFVDSVLIEGRSANASAELIRDKNAENVSVVIAADPAVQALSANYANTAAVGSALGMLSIRKVHENLGSVDILNKPDSLKGNESYPLTDKLLGVWLTACLSGGTPIANVNQMAQKNLENQGYIFAGFYEGYGGIYFNDAPTCTELADDYAYIEMNRTWNKAVRYIRQALTPKMKSTINVDKDSGFIAPSTIAEWENAALKKAGQMLKDDELSDLTISIDPQQNVLSGDPIVIKVSLTPKGIAREIINEIGFANPFNA